MYVCVCWGLFFVLPLLPCFVCCAARLPWGQNRLRYAVTVDCMPISEQVSMKDLDEDIERHLSKAVGSTMSTFS